MNYEEMSDFEVNGYVSMHMHGFSWLEFVDGCASHVKCGNECSPGFAMIEVPDYCNNPSDAMPILIAMKIGFKWVNGSCTASSVLCGYHESTSDKPLRAAMIVFLMMQEQEK